MSKLALIPIYSMPKEEFNYKFDEYVKKTCVQLGYPNDDEAENTVRKCFSEKKVWEYNQIIGYISISISPNEIEVEEHKHLGKIYPFTTKKWNIPFLPNSRVHFQYYNLTNEEITQRLSSIIQGIMNKDKNRFYDLEQFNTVCSNIDYHSICESKD